MEFSLKESSILFDAPLNLQNIDVRTGFIHKFQVKVLDICSGKQVIIACTALSGKNCTQV